MFLYVWSTLGGSRSPGNHVSLWEIRARTGGEPCGDTWSQTVSLVFSTRTDVFEIRDKVLLCASSGEYSETAIICAIVTGIII